MAHTNVLAVDDEVFNLETLKRTLRKNYTVFTATSGEEGMRIIHAEDIHIVLSDLRMPGMSGTELLSRVAAVRPETIRIVLTAHTDVVDLIEAINSGLIYKYVTKPWQAQDLLVTVQRGADHYWSEEEKRHLLQQLQEQNTRLETQNRELKRLDSLKSRFMSIASHELRTPLAIVSGSIELLQMMADNLTQKQAELINNALEGSHRLSGILTSVFDLLRIDAQKYSIRFSPHDLVPLIDKAVEEYAEAARQRRITISQKVTECIADVDPDSIATVFDKLLSNAVKFTPDGGKIEIIRQPDAGDMVHIAVVDNGIGIPRDELNRIFEKFYQLGDVELHSTSKTNFKGGGTGLGLAIVKGIVTLHQGKIYVTSEGERKGSQFHLHLPFRHDRPPLNVKSEAQAEFDFDLLGDDH